METGGTGAYLRTMSTTRAFFTVVSISLLGTAALAGPVVMFEDGRVLRVQDVSREDHMAVLELPGGGELSVPDSLIVNWDDIRVAKSRREAAEQAVARQAATTTVVPASNHHPVRAEGPDLWRRAAGRYAELLAGAAERHDLDPILLTALAHVESRFDARAVSPKGAQGLLQLMPDTAQRFGVEDVFDVAQNVEAGATYLRWLLERYEGRTDLALAGYNAGEQAVDRYNGVPPYSETRMYVTCVLNQVQRLSATR
jgi:soluble lytic murein transglycosylase-like protein